MSDSDSSDGELPLLAAEPPKKRQKPDAAAAAVAAAWRGDDRPLEKPAKPQARAAPKPKPAAPKPSTAAPPPDAPKTVHVSGLPKSATAPLLRQHCVESLDEDESAIVDCRLPPPKKTPPGGGRAPPRFAFVECRDPKAAARLVHALDEAKWLGAQLTVNFARPKGRPRAEERKEAHEMLQAHVEKKERERIDRQAEQRRKERADWIRENGPRVEAERAVARAAGHFGHGFSSDGRPKLHSGYKDML